MSSFEKFQKFLITLLLVAAFFYGGYYFGKRGFQIELKKNPPIVEIINKDPTNKKVDFAMFWQVWDMVSVDYLHRPVDAQQMVYGAISGMVSSLGDPYSSYLPPKVNEIVNGDLTGNYEGVGAELGIKDSQLVVISPLDGSPAKAAGVKAGDKILEINGDSTFGLTVTDAVSRIRGTANTQVKLTLQTSADKPRTVAITRGVINMPSISWKDMGDGVAYIRVSRFYGEDTNKDWDKVVSELNIGMKQLDTIIVDLRDNPGGYVGSAVHIAGEFYRNKPVYFQELATGEQKEFDTQRVGAFDNVPVVYVLINGGSASASEIVAAALRDNIGAKLLGTKSFGKGTMQTAQDFDDGSGLHLTIAKWLTPKKEWVHTVGIQPDIVVEMTDEDRNNGRDPQLDKALELAKKI
jgi:carboxyl-terminal processing protease